MPWKQQLLVQVCNTRGPACGCTCGCLREVFTFAGGAAVALEVGPADPCTPLRQRTGCRPSSPSAMQPPNLPRPQLLGYKAYNTASAAMKAFADKAAAGRRKGGAGAGGPGGGKGPQDIFKCARASGRGCRLPLCGSPRAQQLPRPTSQAAHAQPAAAADILRGADDGGRAPA